MHAPGDAREVVNRLLAGVTETAIDRSRAALRLHKSQPAVSHGLAQLRAHFDDPLLVRREGHMALTPRALALVEPLAEALATLNGLLAEQQFDPAGILNRGRLYPNF